MKKHYFIAIGLALFSSSVWSAVNIIASDDVRVIAIDTQNIKTGLLGTQQNEYKIDPGEHQLHVRYEQFFNHQHSGEHEIVKSDVLVIKTPTLLDGEQYYLALPNQLNNIDDAKAFAKNPTIFLKNQQGEMIAKQSTIQTQQSVLTDGLFSRSYDLIKKKPTTITKSPAIIPTKQKSKDTAKGQKLIDLWNNSKLSEREAFLIWLYQQRR